MSTTTAANAFEGCVPRAVLGASSAKLPTSLYLFYSRMKLNPQGLGFVTLLHILHGRKEEACTGNSPT